MDNLGIRIGCGRQKIGFWLKCRTMNKKKIALCLSSFFAQFSICMINFAMIYYLRGRYNLSSSAIAIASSIYTITYFISCLALKNLYPVLSRKVKVFIAFFAMAFSNIVILISSSIALTYLMLAVYGIAMSFLWPNMEDWITGNDEGSELAKDTNAFNFSWSLGAGLSTYASGLLAEYSLSLPIFTGILILILILTFLLNLAKEDDVKKTKKQEVAEDSSTGLRYYSWAANFLNYACYAIVINVFPLYALEHLGFSESTSGFLLLFRGVATCFTFVLLSQARFYQFNKMLLIFSQLFLAVMFLAFSSLRSIFSLSFFFIIFGFVFALLYEMSIFHGATGASDREKRMIVHEVVLNVGSVLGSVLGGLLYERLSFATTLYIMSALIIITIIVECAFLFGSGSLKNRKLSLK